MVWAAYGQHIYLPIQTYVLTMLKARQHYILSHYHLMIMCHCCIALGLPVSMAAMVCIVFPRVDVIVYQTVCRVDNCRLPQPLHSSLPCWKLHKMEICQWISSRTDQQVLRDQAEHVTQ